MTSPGFPPVPVSRAEWRAWIRTVKPGDVRRGAGVSQVDLARLIGAHTASLSAWERGGTLPGDQQAAEAWFRAVTEMGGGDHG